MFLRLGVGLAIIAAGGCATEIKMARRDVSSVAVSRREALIAAAVGVEPVAFTPAAGPGLAARLAGAVNPRAHGNASAPSRETVIAGYAAALGRRDAGPVAALVSDADRQLDAAATLIETAASVVDAVKPEMADVAVLERAIRNLRDSRAIYLAVLRDLDAAPARDRALVEARLRRDFDRATAKIGGLADAIADAVDADRTREFAAPGASLRPSGSL